MGCVLRISGNNFNVEELIQSSKLKPIKVWKKGNFRAFKKPSLGKHKSSGFNVAVTNCNEKNLQWHMGRATFFLKKNATEIRKLVSYPGVEDVCLDFGIINSGFIARFHHLSADFIKLAAKLNLSVEISDYVSSDSQD